MRRMVLQQPPIAGGPLLPKSQISPRGVPATGTAQYAATRVLRVSRALSTQMTHESYMFVSHMFVCGAMGRWRILQQCTFSFTHATWLRIPFTRQWAEPHCDTGRGRAKDAEWLLYLFTLQSSIRPSLHLRSPLAANACTSPDSATLHHPNMLQLNR